MLLSPDELAPFDLQNRDGRSPFVVICDHAGRLLPRALGTLGLSESDLSRHIAWDIGAGEVARRLGTALDACVVTQRYSRLVIDCNRPLTAFDSIATVSEKTIIPGNQNLGPGDAEARVAEIFRPYHETIRGVLDQRAAAGRATVLVTMHSFTPSFLDLARPWHVGVLYHQDVRVAEPLLRALRRSGDLVVGDNQPYAASASFDYAIIQHGERRAIPYVELEVRQDLISDEAGQTAWALRLAPLLQEALLDLPSPIPTSPR